MPRLTDAEREQVNHSLDTTNRIRDSFASRQYLSQHCQLCNWASNGLTFDEARQANLQHEQQHPEFTAWEASQIPMDLLQRSFHDHECNQATCNCKCGCTVGPFCTLVFGSLCSTCTVRVIRDDSEHGEKVES